MSPFENKNLSVMPFVTPAEVPAAAQPSLAVAAPLLRALQRNSGIWSGPVEAPGAAAGELQIALYADEVKGTGHYGSDVGMWTVECSDGRTMSLEVLDASDISEPDGSQDATPVAAGPTPSGRQRKYALYEVIKTPERDTLRNIDEATQVRIAGMVGFAGRKWQEQQAAPRHPRSRLHNRVLGAVAAIGHHK